MRDLKNCIVCNEVIHNWGRHSFKEHRSKRCLTCSKKCARIYARVYNKVFNEIYKKLKGGNNENEKPIHNATEGRGTKTITSISGISTGN